MDRIVSAEGAGVGVHLHQLRVHVVQLPVACAVEGVQKLEVHLALRSRLRQEGHGRHRLERDHLLSGVAQPMDESTAGFFGGQELESIDGEWAD